MTPPPGSQPLENSAPAEGTAFGSHICDNNNKNKNGHQMPSPPQRRRRGPRPHSAGTLSPACGRWEPWPWGRRPGQVQPAPPPVERPYPPGGRECCSRRCSQREARSMSCPVTLVLQACKQAFIAGDGLSGDSRPAQLQVWAPQSNVARPPGQPPSTSGAPAQPRRLGGRGAPASVQELTLLCGSGTRPSLTQPPAPAHPTLTRKGPGW